MSVERPLEAMLSTGMDRLEAPGEGSNLEKPFHRGAKMPRTSSLPAIQGRGATLMVIDEAGPWPLPGRLAANETLRAISQRAEAMSGLLADMERSLRVMPSAAASTVPAVLQYRGPHRP